MENEDHAHEDSDQSERLNSKDKGKGPAFESMVATEDFIYETIPPAATSKQNEHITFASTAQPNSLNAHEEVYGDNGSTYYSARSRMSFRTIFTRSTGKRSQNGATWLQALTKTMNSGFGGTRVVEGRERGGYLPPETRVGRTGKAPAPVPPAMLKALGVRWTESATVPQRFYGVSLEFLHGRDGLPVPLIVTKCLQALDLYGLNEKRLYARRMSESKAMKQLRDKFIRENTETVRQLDLTKPDAFSNDIRAVAQVLYRFIEQLPDPLLKESFYLAFMKADEVKDAVAQKDQLRAIITNLPKAHFETLKALVEHFGRLLDNSSVNGTDSDSLAGEWAHVILHRGMGLGTEPTPNKIRMRIVQAILDHRDSMLIKPEGG